MSDEIILSIIVPVYNTEFYLQECLVSLLQQDLSNYEIICINDGSTDNSLEILKKYSERHSVIKVYSQDNKGLSATRNRGIDLAEGKYIYFMDSDDILEEYSLKYIIEKMRLNNLDLFVFDAESFFDEENTVNFELIEYDKKKSFGFYETGALLLDDLVKDRVFSSSVCLYVVKKDILIKNNLEFIENIIHEDEAFTVETFLNAGKSLHENRTFFKRRIRSESIMTKQRNEKNFIGYYKVFNRLHKYLKKDTKAINKRLATIFNTLFSIHHSLDETSKNNVYIEYEDVLEKAKANNYYTFTNWLRHYNTFTNSLYRILLSFRDMVNK